MANPTETDRGGWADFHRMGYEAGLRAAQPSDEEVARIRLPVGCNALARIGSGISLHYGRNILMSQRGDWLVFVRSANADPEPLKP